MKIPETRAVIQFAPNSFTTVVPVVVSVRSVNITQTPINPPAIDPVSGVESYNEPVGEVLDLDIPSDSLPTHDVIISLPVSTSAKQLARMRRALLQTMDNVTTSENPSDVAAYYFNATQQLWMRMPTSVYDAVDATVTFNTPVLLFQEFNGKIRFINLAITAVRQADGSMFVGSSVSPNSATNIVVAGIGSGRNFNVEALPGCFANTGTMTIKLTSSTAWVYSIENAVSQVLTITTPRHVFFLNPHCC